VIPAGPTGLAAWLLATARRALDRPRCPVCDAGSGLTLAHPGWRYQLRCGRCGHLFVGSPPGDDLYRFIVQREHRLDGYEARERMDQQAWQAWKLETYRRLGFIDSEADLERPGRVLEVGPAEGLQLEIFARRGWQALAVEPSHHFARQCRGRGLEVIEAYLEDAELPAAAFDLALATHTLEHLRDPGAALTRLHRALDAGGQLILEVPLTVDFSHPEHLHTFTPDSLDRLLRRRGFSPQGQHSYRDQLFGLDNHAVLARKRPL
jgi:SAM-dependent methyltransferase